MLGVAFALYGRTAAPTITWRHDGADSGELVAASYTLGIAHPPGYPTYVLLGRAWSLLPLGEIAHRYSLFSAVCGALAAALAAVLAADLLRRCADDPRARQPGGLAAATPLVCSLAAGLGLAAAPAVWAQATIAEVYALHLALVAAALTLLMRWSTCPAGEGRAWLGLSGLAAGLALGNHVTAIFLVPLGAAYVALAGGRRAGARTWGPAGLALLAGLSVYAYLPLRASQAPPVNWGDPSSLERLVHHVTAADYHGYLLARPAVEVLSRVPVVARLLVEQFTWVGLIWLVLGVGLAWARARREAGLLLGFGLANAALAVLYAARGSQVYLLPAYLVGAVFLGLGAGSVWQQVVRLGTRWRDWAVAALGLVLLLTPLLRMASAFPELDLSGDRSSLEFALRALERAGGQALYTSSDEETFALWYVQRVLGVKPEVPVIDTRLVRFEWYRQELARAYGLSVSGP